jgi:arylsulfatase A-like enzyme
MKIIVYVLDSLRFDHVSCYGYHRKTTPNIDRVADDGIIFERCYTPSTWTRPVAASILTGTYPRVHGVQGRKDVFTASIPRLPSMLREAGFNTACVSAIGNFSTKMGFGEGFEYFCDLYKEPNLMQNRLKTTGSVEGLDDSDEIVFPYAEDINDYFFPWLNDHMENDIFALLWSIQPHAPYEPPEGFQKFLSSSYDGRFSGKRDMVRRVHSKQDAQYLIDLYDSEIHYNDHMIGEIINLLKEQGEYDNTLFIIVSDHGEAFGEHDLYAHGHLPYDGVMRVPMVIKLPHNAHRGAKVSQLVSLLDIMPTLLAYTVIDYPADLMPILMGENLIPVLEDREANVHDYIFCETLYSDTKPIFYGVTSDEWKYMKISPPKFRKRNVQELWNRLIHERIIFSILRNPMWLLKRYGRMKGEMLFNNHNDPAEIDNVMGHHPNVLKMMQDQLESWLKTCQNVSAKFISGYESRDLDETISKQLKALGYLD